MTTSVFIEVRVCAYCNEIIGSDHFVGNEGWTICEGCSVVEGDTETKFECQDCYSLCSEEKCDCEPSL